MATTYDVLGPLEVLREGRPVDLGTPKQRSVLACLLLARGRVVPTERLLAVVWGEDPPPAATANLQVYVSRLRSLLRDDATGISPVTRRSPGYMMTIGEEDLDADVFLRLADRVRASAVASDWASVAEDATEALALWRGGVLADLGDTTWFRAEVEELDSRRVDVSCALVTAQLGLDRVDEAVPTARSLAESAPYRDDVRRLEMLALHRAGRTPEALEVLAMHAETLADELGIDPSAELRDLQVALLRQDEWTLSWPLQPGAESQQVAVGTSEPASMPTVERADTGLVGRERELAAAAELVRAVVDGSARSLVLTGPAGIGKTRLAEEVLAEIRRGGGTVVRGRCLEEEGAPAWWPLRQVVRELGADPDDLLDAPAEAGADTLRFVVYEKLRALLERSATTTPLAVLVDDLQWADPTSARCLVYLASALRETRVLLVATARDAEGSAAARQSIAAVARSEGARQIVVPPLAPDDVVRLAGLIAGDSLGREELDRLAQHTRGNALFVCEYARLPHQERLDGDIPIAVRGVLARRLESLDDEVLRVLQVAAIIGEVLDLSLLSTVSSLARDELVDLLDEAADAAIIEPRQGGAGYGFAHALLRDEVLAGLSPLRRQRLHSRVADALVTAGGDQVTQRAQHLLAAGPLVDPHELLTACRAAALQAEERMSSDSAVSWWVRAVSALELLPEDEQDPQERDNLIVARVKAMVRAGQGQSVLEVIDEGLLEAVRLGRTSTAGRLAATLLRASGTWPWVTFGQDPGPLIARLTGVETAVAGDPRAHAQVLAALAVGHCYDPDPSVPDDLSRRALELAERSSDPEMLADAIRGRVATYVGEAHHAEECEDLLARLLTLPHPYADIDEVFVHSARTMSLIIIGDLAGMERSLRLGISGADRLRLPGFRAQLRWTEVGVADWKSGPEEALRLHEDALQTHRRTQIYDAGFGQLVEMMLLAEAGRYAEIPAYDGIEDLTWGAARAAGTGDRMLAADLVRRRLAETGPAIWMTLAHLTVLAWVVADLELTELAGPVLEQLDPHAGRLVCLGQGPIVGPVDLQRARLLHLLGETDRARDVARASRDLAARNHAHRWVERSEALMG